MKFAMTEQENCDLLIQRTV